MKQKRDIHWWSSPRTLLRAILMLDDSTHSIALGTAVGMFIGMTPTVGIQMILVVLFAFVTNRFLRFNRAAALITVYVSNPITAAPIYWFNYKVGALFIHGSFTYGTFAKVLEFSGFAGWWETIVALFVEIGPPLIVGTLIVAPSSACIAYPTMFWLLRTVRGSKPPEPDREPEHEPAREPESPSSSDRKRVSAPESQRVASVVE